MREVVDIFGCLPFSINCSNFVLTLSLTQSLIGAFMAVGCWNKNSRSVSCLVGWALNNQPDASSQLRFFVVSSSKLLSRFTTSQKNSSSSSRSELGSSSYWKNRHLTTNEAKRPSIHSLTSWHLNWGLNFHFPSASINVLLLFQCSRIFSSTCATFWFLRVRYSFRRGPSQSILSAPD